MNEWVAKYNLADGDGDRSVRIVADGPDSAIIQFRRLVPRFKRRPCAAMEWPGHRSSLYQFDGPGNAWAEVYMI